LNSVKIEKGAVEELRRAIRLHDRMDELLNEDDKGPSWDGDIYLYNNNDLKAEHIQYRIPTQIKGKCDSRLLNRKSITYPVEYKNLRNYFNNGGVCYFVIAISNDGEKASIFYNALTPIKLQSLLKGNEHKRPEQTKSITLIRLKNNDKTLLYNMLLQFGHDSKEQGSGELVRKSISISDLKNIDSIKMTSYASDRNEVLENIQTGEVCLFGHLSSADIWLPFSYDTQKNMEIATTVKRNESFGVDNVPYYKCFEVTKKADKTLYMRLSENLGLRISENKIHFAPKSDFTTVIKDIQFLEAIQQGRGLYIGKKKVLAYDRPKLNRNLEKTIKDFKLIQLAINRFGLPLEKPIEDFDEKDWKAINELIMIYKGDLTSENQVSYRMWWWQDKVVPFILIKDETQRVQAENVFYTQQLSAFVKAAEEEYPVPIFMNFQRDVWKQLYDVPEEWLLDRLEEGTYNHETEGNFSLLLVELLAAYDHTKNEKYYNMARLISDKLLLVSPQNEYWRINKLQLLRRKRSLSEEELIELEGMEEQSGDVKVVCAANILLENKRKARKLLDEMNEDDRTLFMTYPIYNVL